MSDTPSATPPVSTKSMLLSKTIWLQVLMFALGFYPPALAWVKANPEGALGVIAALNVLMRFATSGKVSILPPEDLENKDGTSGVVSLLAIGMAAGLLGVSLPSCSSGDYPFAGTISYRDPHSGAKAGLSYSPRRKLRGGITVPIYDAQTGEQLGVTDVVIGDK